MSMTLNPLLTTNARGTFGTSWQGLMQGTAYDDPATRNALSGGRLITSAALPMWGGVGITEAIAANPLIATARMGNSITRATLLTGALALTGFSVFDQNHSALVSPQSTVPLVPAGGTMNFYRLGSGARIAVKCDPALVSLYDDIITSQVSWDFNGQKLIPYTAAYAANVITNATWSAGEITFTTTTAHGLSVGSVISISGFVPTTYNGVYTCLSGTASSTIKVAKTSDPGTDTTQGQLDAGGGALACKVLDIQAGNSLTVDYDTTTGFATFNASGTAAVILI